MVRGSSAKWEVKPYLYILPMVVIFGVFSVYPMLRTVFLSFVETNVIATQMDFVGLDNYSDMTEDRHFWRIVGNTAIYGFSQVILTMVLGLLLAAVANSKAVKFRTLFRLSAFYPYVLPIAVAAMVWIYLYNPSRGAINLMLDERIPWLSSYDYALPALIIVSVWKSLGFSFLLILAGMQNISKEYYEAAALETNNPIKSYFKLTLPMLTPTLFVVCLLCVTSSFQSMDLVAIMTQGGPGHSSNVLMYYIYQEGIINRRLGYGSAMSTIFLLVLVAFTIVYLKYGERKVEYER
ncbi:carbohydrate ABC transporter permease [Paenibacillus sp. strain BS8-2]